MRTLIDIHDDLMKELLREANTGVKKEAIILAIKTFLNVRRREKLASLVGKYESGYSRKQLEEMREEFWGKLAEFSFGLFRKGIVVPLTDTYIALLCIENNASLMHRDKHFDLISGNTPLKVWRE